MTTLVVLAFGIGVVAGLRAMMPLAAVAWGARLGCLRLAGTHLGWMGSAPAAWIFGILAVGELITDQLPSTPSRKVPPQFGARVVTGSVAGAALGLATGGSWIVGLLCGLVGAVVGTLGGAAVRAKLAALFGKDLPAALLEDVVAIGLSALVIAQACR